MKSEESNRSTGNHWLKSCDPKSPEYVANQEVTVMQMHGFGFQKSTCTINGNNVLWKHEWQEQ